MYKLTIVVAIYNVENYLKKCLDSLVNQTCGDYQVFCVNDGSTDKSRDIILSYLDNKKFIDKWMTKYNVNGFKLRDKKFEWQAGANYNSVWETSIQLRQSGIRCKKPDYFPTLVAMVQTPIIGKYKRRMTPREVARLQSFPDTFKYNKDLHQAYKQFGNSANIEIIKFLAKQLLVDILEG